MKDFSDKKSISKPLLLVASLFIFFLVFMLLFNITQQSLGLTAHSSKQVLGVMDNNNLSGSSLYLVSRVIDGDTIELSNGIKVRYIGIDAPETVDPRRPVGCFGREANQENKKLVEGKQVILKKDISEVDSFGRWLRYVYLPNNNQEDLFINDYLVRSGYAWAATYPPDVQFAPQFLEAEQYARVNSLGLWSKCSL
ncbi:thermonuclease family protein [Patescibacteria group bacterium]|nr:thermonuclease family protein [Patescibacteria group bacterium]MCL5409599.1 thermonuclease family protein [Patescibacteria group bacterium]